ncbi:MAG: alpha/beta fold hydrolase [Thermodesulfobacteriota bacterium]
MLEVKSEKEPLAPPLLFIHGAWHGAWCWEPLMHHLAFRGLDSFALDLPGHGQVRERDPGGLGLEDYVAAVEAFVRGHLPEPPILVGHSMGGLIVQKYLETNRAPAAVLLGPCPATGASLTTLLKFSARYPITGARVVFGRTLRVTTLGMCRRLFFHQVAPENLRGLFHRLGPESTRALRQMVLPGFKVRAARIPSDIPVAVIAAGHDYFFPHKELEKWARGYGYDFLSFPEAGHNLQSGPEYKQVGDRLSDWLEEKLGPGRFPPAA